MGKFSHHQYCCSFGRWSIQIFNLPLLRGIFFVSQIISTFSLDSAKLDVFFLPEMEVAFSYLGCYGNMQQRRCLAEHQELQWSGLRFEISGRCQTGEPSNIGSFIFLEKASLKGGRYNNKVWKTGANRHILKKSSISRKQVGGLCFFSLVIGINFLALEVVWKQVAAWKMMMIIFSRDFPPGSGGTWNGVKKTWFLEWMLRLYPCFRGMSTVTQTVWLLVYMTGSSEKIRWCFGFEKSPKKPGFFFVRALRILTLQKTHGSKKPLRKKTQVEKHPPLEAPIILRVDIFFEKKDRAKNIWLLFFLGIDNRQSEKNIYRTFGLVEFLCTTYDQHRMSKLGNTEKIILSLDTNPKSGFQCVF